MRRHHRTLLAALAVSGAIAVAAPALAQIDPGELQSLERRRDELTIELGEVDAQLEQLALEISDLEDQTGFREVEVELVADEIEWTAFTRQEPAATRVEIAIVGFTQGDPRQNELLNEVRTLEGDDESSRRRALYESVIDDTADRLTVIDKKLVELVAVLESARARLAGTDTALSATRDDRVQTGIRRSEIADELADTLQRIERLRSLEARSVLTGTTTFDDPTRPALAVKIDNVGPARPQAGINQADIVFVEEVEGGLTRLAAVFHSQGSDVVGPVRSMRTGDLDLLGQFNGPLFANSGGNRGTRSRLGDSTLIDVGVNAQSDLYYRDRSRRAPSNLFTNTFNLWSVGRVLEGVGTPSPLFDFRTGAQGVPTGATRVNSASIDYGSTQVAYSWNGSGWDRSQDGSPTVDTEGVRTAPTTVVVQFVDYIPSSADGRSPEAVTLGDGLAWIFTDGRIVQAIWSRETVTDQTKFRNPTTGIEVPILPGRIWIELPRPGKATFS
jgi:DUF3048 family protein